MMLSITNDQMKRLEAKHIERFKSELKVYVEKNFPLEIKALNNEPLMAFLDMGINEARLYGLTSESDICVFFNIKFLLNIFVPYTVNAHHWIVSILNNETLGNPSARLAHLCERVDSYLDALGV